MKTMIYKQVLKPGLDLETITGPILRILSVQRQGNMSPMRVSIWYEADADPRATHAVINVARLQTGDAVPDWFVGFHYIATVQSESGGYVEHVYMRGEVIDNQIRKSCTV